MTPCHHPRPRIRPGRARRPGPLLLLLPTLLATLFAAPTQAAATPAPPTVPSPAVPSPAVLPPAVPSPVASVAEPLWSALGVTAFQGRAFDACTAPPLATMKSWRDSPYGAVGVYFGGRGRACAQPRLTADWTREVRDLGWAVLPVYVGSQAPCVKAKNKQKVRLGKNPAGTGTKEGKDAVRRAAALGIQPLSPLYLDMEAYDHRDAKCAASTLSFVQAWNRAVEAEGYVSGFYSSADSGVAHMEQARRAGVLDLPAVMWFARWGGNGSLEGERVLDEDAWQPQRRIHQYRGNVKEKHGGRTLTVDRNLVDAPVATIA